MSHPKDWKHSEIEHLQDCRVFSVARSLAESPHTGEQHPFYRIESADWVNVVPVTTDDEIVMVRQFRHGAREVTLEIPGGLIDPGESPAEAAVRELLEETGYGGGKPAESLGVVNPNPALFGNTCHSFVVRGVSRIAQIANSATEETVVQTVPRSDLRRLLADGAITHALVVAALYWFDLGRASEDS